MTGLTVYLETSVISYLVSRLSRDYLVSAHQRLTREWWETRRSEYEVFISQLVIEEIEEGDLEEAKKRVAAVTGIPIIATDSEALELASRYISKGILGEGAFDDALHMATASIKSLDYLLTWNCKHIANEKVKRAIEHLNEDFGWSTPFICTPLELIEITGA